jgi:ferredoxin
MAREEADFLTSCIRCSECIKACPTGILKPAKLEYGIRAFWSPVMVPTVGPCLEECNACSQVCPTDAILKYAIDQKYTYKSGTAVFESSRCIGYTKNKYCNECVKACPTNAIDYFKGWEPPGGTSADKSAPLGKTASRPMGVSFERCIGCGWCEYVCDKIVYGDSAQIVTSFGRAVPAEVV